MDENTALLIKISTQVGVMAVKMENLETFMVEHKREMQQMREDLKSHEIDHNQVAKQKDVDELWKVVREIKAQPANVALGRWTKASEIFWASVIGAASIAFIGYIAWSVVSYIVSGGKILK